ncbi:TetR/AcrR family transcriptional regulator [Yinghuangia seranimata]|uniref:TetR/AcrR family transcriptional regulator n=1 Tax=Yinghuangia seranimata TaxID=408067 RepID=UPI00248BB645|nr:TetR/AcrR family transcriptional regulator [Yinghuangia seranimata]MDI2131182.1 TetR family transcriptional regulator [Yinghuangia seranimata]
MNSSAPERAAAYERSAEDPRPAADRPRRRDAAASRKALLDAARALFGERGYDRTTLRDIGDRAGVDAALVARYYGNKAGLYLAAIEEDGQDAVAARRDLAHIGALADFLVARIDDLGGPGPAFRAALGEEGDEAVRAEASAAVRRSMVDPMVERMGGDEAAARPRVELAVAALIGLAVIRPTGFFPELTGLSREDLVALVEQSFGTMLAAAEE